jgi:Fe2+ transport system protein FeoA
VFTHTLSFVNGTQLLLLELGEGEAVTVEQLDDGQLLLELGLVEEQQVTVEQLDDGQQLYGVGVGEGSQHADGLDEE